MLYRMDFSDNNCPVFMNLTKTPDEFERDVLLACSTGFSSTEEIAEAVINLEDEVTDIKIELEITEEE